MTGRILLLVLAFPIASSGQSPPGELAESWPVPRPNVFRQTLETGPGFSFSLGGEPLDPGGRGWRVSTRVKNGTRETVFRNDAGLEAIRTCTVYPECDAIEYTVRFRNSSSAKSAVLERINALDIGFGRAAMEGSYVVSSGGGTDDSVYPPNAFAIRRRYFSPAEALGREITLTTKGGRSSNQDLPFYFIQNDRESAGVFVAIGWSGQWSSTVKADFASGRLRVTGGIPDLHIRLDPGEEIPGPTVLIGSYRGPLATGSNQLRQLIRHRYTPRLDGRPFEPIATYDHWWDIETRFDEGLLRHLADAAQKAGQEYFLLDAGWYAGCDGPDGFSGGVGNWDEVDRRKFPGGLRPFADYVRSRGLKFGLWFEPERVARGSLLAKNHPDWVTWKQNGKYGLLDYGQPNARLWVRTMIDRYIQMLDIRYIRYDFNMDPLAYWDLKDSPDRRGMAQIRHIEGFYQVIDWIREHNPQTVLEGCASGGRRIDLETARRFHTFWISDQTAKVELVRYHLAGINYFLPGNYSYVCYVLRPPPVESSPQGSLACLNCFGGAFGTGGRIDEMPEVEKRQLSECVALYKRLRPLLMDDYYPLLPQSSNLDSWDGWQFNDRKEKTGFIQAFRGNSEVTSMRLRPSGLDPKTDYEFADPFSHGTIHLDGLSAMKNGVEFSPARMGVGILIYKPSGE